MMTIGVADAEIVAGGVIVNVATGAIEKSDAVPAVEIPGEAEVPGVAAIRGVEAAVPVVLGAAVAILGAVAVPAAEIPGVAAVIVAANVATEVIGATGSGTVTASAATRRPQRRRRAYPALAWIRSIPARF